MYDERFARQYRYEPPSEFPLTLLITLDSRDEEIWCMAHLRFLHALLCGYVCDMTKMILGCDRIGWRMWRMWRCV